MKITFLSPNPNLSGGQRVKSIYARELIKMGHDVSIVCSVSPSTPLLRKAKKLLLHGEWLREPTFTNCHYVNYGIPHSIANRKGFLEENEVPDSDVLIATFWTSAEWAAGWPERKGKKFYLVQHDEGAMFGPRAENTYNTNFKHIYVSGWIRDRVQSRHPDATGTLIPNAIDAADFDQGARKKEPHLRVGMMWAGATIKGGDIAIDAVRRLRRDGHQVELIAFGESKPPQDVLQEINLFEYRPSQSRIAEIYASCTAWLFTSRFEGFGLPILEAMAARTPVIATPTGAATELIANGGGMMVPMEDPAALADAILRLGALENSQWQQMSDAAHQTACSLNWSQAAAQFEAYISK